jgi:hypothetical protein
MEIIALLFLLSFFFNNFGQTWETTLCWYKSLIFHFRKEHLVIKLDGHYLDIMVVVLVLQAQGLSEFILINCIIIFSLILPFLTGLYYVNYDCLKKTRLQMSGPDLICIWCGFLFNSANHTPRWIYNTNTAEQREWLGKQSDKANERNRYDMQASLSFQTLLAIFNIFSPVIWM